MKSNSLVTGNAGIVWNREGFSVVVFLFPISHKIMMITSARLRHRAPGESVYIVKERKEKRKRMKSIERKRL